MYKTDLFSTPFWEFDKVFEPCTQNFLGRCSNLNIQPKENFNIFDYGVDGCPIKETEKLLLSFADICLPDHEIEISRGWVNSQRKGEALLPHSHGNELVCCLYLQVPENSGDLMLLDPRGGVNWLVEQEGNYSGFKGYRYKPKAYQLIFFPGYLLHYVTENQSEQTRYSLAVNFNVSSK